MKRVERRLFNKKIFLTTGFIFLLALAVFSSIKLVSVEAKNNESQYKYKYYTSYEVQPGDTLTDIAQEYITDHQDTVTDYIQEVKRNNEMTTENITAGEHIIIAYYSTEKK